MGLHGGCMGVAWGTPNTNSMHARVQQGQGLARVLVSTHPRPELPLQRLTHLLRVGRLEVADDGLGLPGQQEGRERGRCRDALAERLGSGRHGREELRVLRGDALELGGQLGVHVLERHDCGLGRDEHLLGPQLQVAVVHLQRMGTGRQCHTRRCNAARGCTAAAGGPQRRRCEPASRSALRVTLSASAVQPLLDSRQPTTDNPPLPCAR
jgi:hypothetical protein